MSKALLRLIFLLTVTIFSLSFVTANTNSEIDSLLKKASEFKNKNSDSVFYYTLSALELSKELGYPRYEYKSLILLTKHNIKVGNLGDAITNCIKAEKIVELNNFSEYLFEVLMYKGVAYKNVGLSSDALRLFFEAHKQITNSTNFKKKIDLNFYIASVYSEINELDKSYQYIQSAIKLSKDNDYLIGAFESYILLSNIYYDLDSVIKYLEISNDLLQIYPDSDFKKVILLNNQALVNKAIGKIEISKSQYIEAINISKSNNFQSYLTNLYNNYAYLLVAESKYDSANIVLEKALRIAQGIKSTDLQASIYDSYSDYFTSIKDYKNALVYQDSSITKRKQFVKEQRIQESIFLSVVFETEKKEKEILEQENKINRMLIFQVLGIASLIFVIGLVLYFRQKFQLSKSRLQTVRKDKELEVSDAMVKGQDSERERIAMDLHDGLGAKLSAMRFLADGFFSSNERYNELSDFITNIHQNIRELSHRLKPTQLKSLGLPATINGMVATVNKSEKFRVDFKTNIERRLSDKLELNIYYLTNELVNNATKHSNGNVIFIQLYEEDNKIISLTVEDNGSGFNPKKAADGLGLQNIKSRVEYLGGTLFIESSETETNFMIEIPI